VVTPGERVVVPGTGQRNIAVVVGVGLVLTGRTEGTDDVVFVGRCVAVSHHNPNAGVTVGVGDVGTDLEHLVHAAVEQGGCHHVVGLPNSHTTGQTVGADGSQATVVDHGRRSDVHSTVAGGATLVGTVVAVERNIHKNDVGTGPGLTDFGGDTSGRRRDRRLTHSDAGVAGVNDVSGQGTVAEDTAVDGHSVLRCRTRGRGLEGVQGRSVQDHGPATARDAERANVEFGHVQRFRGDGVARHGHVTGRDVGEGTRVDACHGQVARSHAVKDGGGARRSVTGLRCTARSEGEVVASQVHVHEDHGFHGVNDRAVAVGGDINVRQVCRRAGLGTGSPWGVLNGSLGVTRSCVGQGHVRHVEILKVDAHEVLVGVAGRDVLHVEHTAAVGVQHANDGTVGQTAVGVTVRHRTFHQGHTAVLWQVETGLGHTADGEVGHGQHGALAAAVREHGANVREGHVGHGVVTGVTVRR